MHLIDDVQYPNTWTVSRKDEEIVEMEMNAFFTFATRIVQTLLQSDSLLVSM